ncbi:tRNA (adenine(58)-N(1))-methyltransferase non-catalytic subunit TRM6 [Ambystoma mexicanum]|uniref:tRNA (adenine(58)-N(1))-methyltransferase non-catalytic subunit TRM6 n=1 Tax=Ambystoma mexicanum TaxID=8296 RepID=UPI0037E75807
MAGQSVGEHIRDGAYVVLKRGEVFKAAQVQRRKKAIFGKQWIFLDNAIGQCFGTSFEITGGGKLMPLTKMEEATAEKLEAGADNRNIVDDGKSQKLTRDDIEALKEKGIKGEEIVQQLIENSATFRDKTGFAQEKYIKKKKKKYESVITIVKPCTRILAMMYYAREPGKICNLRYDTLAQMLTLGNIHAGSKVIVMETCAGLVLGAVMERMGGFGSVIQMYQGGEPGRAATDCFGFPETFLGTLHEFPLGKVQSLLSGVFSSEISPEETDSVQTGQKPNGSIDETHNVTIETEIPTSGRILEANHPDGQDAMEVTSGELKISNENELKERKYQVFEKKKRQIERRKREIEAANLLKDRNADGLILASRFHPTPLLLPLLDLVAPSRPFVVYCQYKEPLLDCYTKLREKGGVINLKLSETWLRNYQVLPNRSHPKLTMSGGGGYLLTGLTVVRENVMPSVKSLEPQKTEEPVTKKLKLEEL